MVRPFEAERLVRPRPPLKVEVAVPVFNRVPARLRPAVELSEAAEIPPEKVEEAVEVLEIEPPEIVMPFELSKLAVLMPPAKVEVALVPVPWISSAPPMTVEVALPVPVR